MTSKLINEADVKAASKKQTKGLNQKKLTVIGILSLFSASSSHTADCTPSTACCLPDAAAEDVWRRQETERLIDASTAFRVNPDWDLWICTFLFAVVAESIAKKLVVGVLFLGTHSLFLT
jgi:N-acetyl-gamma-glutamylphosphate reductase